MMEGLWFATNPIERQIMHKYRPIAVYLLLMPILPAVAPFELQLSRIVSLLRSNGG